MVIGWLRGGVTVKGWGVGFGLTVLVFGVGGGGLCCGFERAVVNWEGNMDGVGVGGLAREGRKLSDRRGEGWLG